MITRHIVLLSNLIIFLLYIILVLILDELRIVWGLVAILFTPLVLSLFNIVIAMVLFMFNRKVLAKSFFLVGLIFLAMIGCIVLIKIL